MNKIKAVIFDMDGVLIDAKDWHYNALNKALSFFNFTEISRDEHLKVYDGLSTMKKLSIHPETKALPLEKLKNINNKKQDFTLDFINDKSIVNDGHQYALSQLKTEGYNMAVCSNAVKKSVSQMLEKADVLKFIDFYLSNNDVKNPKPDPEIYVQAIKKLNLKPNEVLICEDNINGIKSALDSGAFVMEVGSLKDLNYNNIKQTIANCETCNEPQLLSPPIKVHKLSDMCGGWFVGNFSPSALKSKDFEVAVKDYKAGDQEKWHVHKVSTELTVILEGKVKMNDEVLCAGEIISIKPGFGTSFEALTNAKTVVVKTPSVLGDKYFKD